MENKELYAALTALLTVGVLLLNFGAESIRLDLKTGLILVAIGAGLILGATVVFKLLADKVVEAKLLASK